MKKLTAILLALFLLAGISPAQWKFHQRKLAQLNARSSTEIQYLIMNDFIIDKVEGLIVDLYLNEEEISRLKSQGYNVDYIPDPAKIYADWLHEQTWNTSNPMDDYHTFEELTAELQQIADQHSDICNLVNAGFSVQGRELWVMKISDNVDIEEDEPEFFYVSSMHGDEVVGMEMCMYLINYLVDNYPEDPQVRLLLDETCIYIMPSMNPDGTEAHSRFNANGFDLNREFPDRIEDPFNYPTNRPQEVQVMMDFCWECSSVLSANYHGGTLVVNYPFDSNPNHQSVYTPSPDDAWFIDLSLTYSTLNSPMYNGPFSQGITNGADWYAIYGGMQDWCYEWKGRADVTIEISEDGWPPASTLPGFWEDNRQAMLAYMEMVHQGIRGIITDANTGQPLPAIITIDDNPHEVYTDSDIGDYYRLLLPGTYDVHFNCYGYQPITVEDIIVIDGELTRVDVQMSPAAQGYSFDDLEGSVGEYTHSSISGGYSDQWHLSEQRSVSPTHSWKCGSSGTGNYNNYLDCGLVTPVIDILSNATLSFWHYMDSEVSAMYYPYAYDGGLLEIKMAGDTVWTMITPEGGYKYRIRNTGGTGPFPQGTPVFAGHIDGREAVFDLSQYQGEAQFRFRFGSDGSVVREGWYIDDIEVTSPLAAPIVLDISIDINNVILNWQPISGVSEYNIYFSTEPYPAEFTLLNTAASTTYIDIDRLLLNTQAFYQIKGIID